MTTAVNKLNVYLSSTDRKVGEISLPVGGVDELTFTYDAEWAENGFAISPHLPMEGSIPQLNTKNFLRNLLPEGSGLDALLDNTTLSRGNTFGLVAQIGQETSGALTFLMDGAARKETSFSQITDKKLTEKLSLATRGLEDITYWDGTTRLSVAGVQDKLNLLDTGDAIGFGEGNLCSNKIYKFQTGKLPHIAINEMFTMQLAKCIGIDIPDIEIKDFGGVRAFVIDRFDRSYERESETVRRRHVIDGCQATNLPPTYKYERNHGDGADVQVIRDGVSLPKLFNIKTTNQLEYHRKLIEWLTFNIITRNHDAHGKNISFFVRKEGVELAPFYDLVNVEAVQREIERLQKQANSDSGRDSSTPQFFAMSIGEYEHGELGVFESPFSAYNFADLADEVGISLERFEMLMEQTITKTEKCLNIAKEEAIKFALSDEEVQHIDLCIQVTNEGIQELRSEVNHITDYKDCF